MVTLDPRRIRRVLLATVAVLAVLTALSRSAHHWAPGSPTAYGLGIFDAGLEASVATFLTALLLLASAVLAAAAARADALMAWRWRLFALVLAVLAIDEAVELHEMTIGPVRRLLDAGGVLYFAWVVPGALFVVALVVVLRPLLDSLPRRERRVLVVAGALFFGGAIGFELAEGWVFENHGGDEAVALIPLISVEETFEMVGVVLLLHGLMLHLAPWAGTVQLAVDSGSARQPLRARHEARVDEGEGLADQLGPDGAGFDELVDGEPADDGRHDARDVLRGHR